MRSPRYTGATVITSVPSEPSGSAAPQEHRRRGLATGRVLVLNATYEPINVCTVKRAIVLLLKDKAEVIEHAEWELRSATQTIARPMVIRLVTYVRIPRDTHRRKITRRAVFARDNWTCQYCGARANLTVDHVDPALQGWPLELGEHRRVVRSVQSPQGQRSTSASWHAAVAATAHAGATRLHPGFKPDYSHSLARVPGRVAARARVRGRSGSRP